MPPTPHIAGLAHLTDPDGRLLMLKTAEGNWRLPGGPALPNESARNAMAYHVRRDLHIRVEPRFVLGMEPIVGTGSSAYLFACDNLQADDIARIQLPGARTEITAFAFVDYPGIAEGVSPHEHLLITGAATALRTTEGR
ncbi:MULTISPECIES: NUDIX hydrolase [Streptomyces]|uniref:NUDIX hydrolase n=1 Tax=Streptomyces TaxID=1883 RepID=UPI00163CC896|nr:MULTISPECIES: NUDIX hydrolase [Streptomyces]MBC2874830.1 NUDIX hydrolase [Streptomyces sp. TYQ1024]UBI37280.1 NUDIX hydrolase [Streptomyces mobaraensis]UKW29871.1 NUDIX hydrolase [Streptomyces sp. TYQ1024]